MSNSVYMLKVQMDGDSSLSELEKTVCTGVFGSLRALLDFCVSSNYMAENLSDVKVMQNWRNPIKAILSTEAYTIEVTETSVISENPYDQEFVSNDQIAKIFGKV